MRNPKVSVCVPLYNYAQYLPECLESILAQTFLDYEIVLADDGSTDNSLQVAREYAQRFPEKVHIFTHPGGANQGISATCNLAMSQARGEYIAWLGSDDAWYPQKLALQVAQLEADPALGLVYALADIVDSNGVKTGETYGKDITDNAIARLICGNLIPALTAIQRRSLVEQIGAYDESLVYSDWEMWLRTAEHARIGFLSQVVARYRVHGRNLYSGKPRDVQLRHNLTVMDVLAWQAQEPTSPLAVPRHQALIDLHKASLHFALEKQEEAAVEARRAFQTDPSLAEDPQALSAMLRDFEAFPEFGLFLADFFPQEAAASSRHFTAQQSFLAARQARPVDILTARRYALRALISRPRWLGRHELLGIVLESLISRKAFHFMRTLLKGAGRPAVLSLIILALAFNLLGITVPPQINSNWSQPVDITDGATTNWRAYGFPICDPYQNMHIFWADNSDSGAAIYYRDDANGYWSVPIDIIAVHQPSIYNLVSATSAQMNQIYLAWTNLPATADLYFSKAPLALAASPRTWSQPRLLDTGVTNASLAVDLSGVIHLIYASSKDQGINFDVVHIQSTDGGNTWSDRAVFYSKSFSQPSYIQTQIAIDGRGRIHVGLTLRSQAYGEFFEVGYIRSLDSGHTWSEYRLISNTSTTFQGVAGISPYAFGNDEIHLTWHDPRRMDQWSYDGGETWSSPVEIMPLGGAFGGSNELVKDSAGVIHVIAAVSNGVFSAAFTGERWGPPEQIDNREIDPHGQHIAICQGNQLHVVYFDRTGEETVWYSARQVNAPHIDRKAIPTPTPTIQPAATGVALAGTGLQATPTPVHNLDAGPQILGNLPNPLSSLMSALIPTILLIGIAFLFYFRRVH